MPLTTTVAFRSAWRVLVAEPPRVLLPAISSVACPVPEVFTRRIEPMAIEAIEYVPESTRSSVEELKLLLHARGTFGRAAGFAICTVPARMFSVPAKLLLPDSETVFSPYLVSPPEPPTPPVIEMLPTPPMPVAAEPSVTEPPHEAVAVVLLFVSAPAPATPVPESVSASAATDCPLRSSTAPVLTAVLPSAVPSADPLPSISVPAVTDVLPAYELLPESVAVPAAPFVTEPAPEIAPAIVWAAVPERSRVPSLAMPLVKLPEPSAPAPATRSVLPAPIERRPSYELADVSDSVLPPV